MGGFTGFSQSVTTSDYLSYTNLDFVFTANSATSTFVFSGQNLTGGTALIDDVSVSVSAIPEPSTYALFGGIAVLGLSVWQRRGRKTRAVTAG